MKSAFNGKLEEIPDICIDNFERNDCSEFRAFFLSHCHADHMQGLDTTIFIDNLKKSKTFLYMSELSADIITYERASSPLVGFIKTLKLGTTLINLPAEPEKDKKELCLAVTTIPAGHSLGSVMFLFKTTSKTILYTGDFRINVNDIPKYGYLHRNGQPVTIDCMYLDTTFIKEVYDYFPKRSSSVEYLVREMKKWIDLRADNRVAIHTPARYCYEFVFNEVYKSLKLKTYVDTERWKFYRSHTKQIYGVTNDHTETKIHLCRNRSPMEPHFSCIPSDSKNHRYLYIHLSAMKWSNMNDEDLMVNKMSENRIDVCFPTHCSRSELKSFVSYFSPVKIVGFPNMFDLKSPLKKSHDDFNVVLKKRKMVSIDDKIEDIKVDKTLLLDMFG